MYASDPHSCAFDLGSGVSVEVSHGPPPPPCTGAAATAPKRGRPKWNHQPQVLMERYAPPNS
jgi:hypothetical protein